MKQVSVIFAFVLLVLLSAPLWAAAPVKTESGQVEGTAGNNPMVRIYKGIPYAAPPVGDLRWAPPQPPAHWQGIRKATEFGNRCPQNHAYNDMVFRDKGESEDCLYLNVWLPASAKANAKLPVLFWLHGGGYEAGSGDEPRYDGESFAGQGIVVVSINYRLGVLGFFAHPDLATNSPQHATGNYGLLDIAAALKWVHNNIGAFGGDPAHVTIGGESAGSMAVSAVMASPLSKGLYAAAIGESGAVFTPKPTTYFRTVSTATAESRSVDWVKAANASSVGELRARPFEELAKTPFRGIVNAHDGLFFDKDPMEVYEAGDQGHVPVLLGWNSEEAKGGIKQKPTVESYKAFLQSIFHDDTDEALRYFPARDDTQAYDSMLALESDLFTVFPTWLWSQYQSQSGHAPVYRYVFKRAVPGGVGVVHASEIEYVFDTLNSKKGVTWTDGDRELARTMNAYWANFIRTGNPNGGGLPLWPSYDEDKVMGLDLEVKAVPESYKLSHQFLDFYTASR